jgi:glycosyltransferase involved in cell wall biosynthesis
MMREREPAPRLFVVGDGPLRGALEARTRDLGLGDRVFFTGLVADVRPWLAHLDAMVVPSRREGLPTVLLEALAAGCPIVATRVGGVPEIVADQQTGLLVPPGDAQALGRALQRVLADPQLRHRLASTGRQVAAERFGLPHMLRRTEQLYRQLLQARGEASWCC